MIDLDHIKSILDGYPENGEFADSKDSDRHMIAALHNHAVDLHNGIREAIACLGNGRSPLAVAAAKRHLQSLIR